MQARLLVALAVLALAGCTANVATTSVAPTSAAPTGTSRAVVAANATVQDFSRISMVGQTPAGGCVFSLTSYCQFQGGSNYIQPLKIAGTPVRFHGNASLTSGLTGATQIQVIVFATVNGQQQIADGNHTFAGGPSPLSFDMDLTHVPKGAPLDVEVYSATGEGAPVGYAIMDVQQDFQLSGLLVSTETAAVAAAAPPTSTYAA